MAVHPRRAPRSPPLSSHFPAQVQGDTGAPPGRGPGKKSGASPGAPVPGGDHGSGLARFNALPHDTARAALLRCCGSGRWAHRLAAHRPYPDLAALLAAADEASYDLSQGDLTGALARECSAELAHGASYAALLALDAARAEYERTFGHAFVICLDGHPPEERVDALLAAIRRRMAHETDEERAISADELRRLAQARLVRLLERLPTASAGPITPGGPSDGPSAADFGLFAPVG
ncbi:2-oxo-4-hydroxy-4-carboxy-5-ureidoimidazoline decarboxylase [Streptomyces sp. NPDC046557]|uniref:2-oxo-4-hydroxy-4-carboxy-5-ureidoimidazoline decarboxylase n=1 Tax=Streptomyces sp. NPDC046557 TaxID=3155372 RepID=UPI0033F59FC6